MKEEFLTDRFHPQFGSILGSFIGSTIDGDTSFYVESEVRRVLANYQVVQLNKVTKNSEIFSDDELLDTVNAVNVSLARDTVNVEIIVTTVATSTLSINTSIGF